MERYLKGKKKQIYGKNYTSLVSMKMGPKHFMTVEQENRCSLVFMLETCIICVYDTWLPIRCNHEHVGQSSFLPGNLLRVKPKKEDCDWERWRKILSSLMVRRSY